MRGFLSTYLQFPNSTHSTATKRHKMQFMITRIQYEATDYDMVQYEFDILYLKIILFRLSQAFPKINTYKA